MGCAAGHLTGRTGYINMTNLKDYDMTFDDRVSPPLRDLVGKSVLLKCEQPRQNAMPKMICKQISNAAVSFTASDEDVGFTAGGAIAIVILICLVIGIGSAWYYGKKHPRDDTSTDNKFAALGDKSPVVTASPDIHTSNNDNNLNGNGAAAPLKPPPAPLVTQVDNDTRGAAFSVANNNDTGYKESMALPATEVTADTTPVGTMNEGGGYLNEEDDEALPPPVNDEEVIAGDIENQDEEYEYYDE